MKRRNENRRRPSERQVALAIDIGGTNLRVAMVSRNGTILGQRSEPTPRGRAEKAILAQIIRLTRNLFSIGRKIKGIGVSVPGFLDRSGSTVSYSPNFPNWRNVQLAKSFRRELQIPCYLENDGNCAALGEHWKGAARGLSDVVFLTLGTGVGGGILMNGHLVRGARGGGAELGHIIVDPRGHLCGCGNRGCLEAMASGTAMKRRTGRSAEELFRRSRGGDRRALRTFEEMGRALASGIASLAFCLDPDLVVVGGNLSHAFSAFAPAMKRELRRRLRNHPARNLEVVRGRYPNDASLLGAAYLVFAGGNRRA
ncbi:MAG TPA: ROK family protein [Bdellovibrionota bacterium]|nr:ROK family protein [Bdellovibrionota bacterium]